jgi:hypothetical protein
MAKSDEETRIDAEVQKRLTAMVTEQQKQLAKAMEQMTRDGLKGVDKANAALEKERGKLEKEMDATRAERKKLEDEAESLVNQFFAKGQKQFHEAAQTELLRNLVRKHLENGKSPEEIAYWLDVPMRFIKQIQELIKRVAPYREAAKKRNYPSEGQRLRYSDEGRGGTIWYEAGDKQFDMWWEFAGGDALVILDIPTVEQWEERTGIPLLLREQVLHFVGEQVVADKISGAGSYIIGSNVITFYA